MLMNRVQLLNFDDLLYYFGYRCFFSFCYENQTIKKAKTIIDLLD